MCIAHKFCSRYLGIRKDNLPWIWQDRLDQVYFDTDFYSRKSISRSRGPFLCPWGCRISFVSLLVVEDTFPMYRSFQEVRAYRQRMRQEPLLGNTNSLQQHSRSHAWCSEVATLWRLAKFRQPNGFRERLSFEVTKPKQQRYSKQRESVAFALLRNSFA